MSPEWTTFIQGLGIFVASAGGIGGLAGVVHHYRKNGKALPVADHTVQTVVRVDDASPADDTSRLAALVKDAPVSDVKQLIGALKDSIQHRPATQADVSAAIDTGLRGVRSDINGHFQTVDAAIGGLRGDVSELRTDVNGLMGRPPPLDTDDEIRVPVKQQ